MPAEPICTVEGDATCWAPDEVDAALDRIICGGANGGQTCGAPRGSSVTAVYADGEAARVDSEPHEAKQSVSGVPEFNAFEEGCGD